MSALSQRFVSLKTIKVILIAVAHLNHQVFQLKRMNFGFVRLTFITKDGIEHEKITLFCNRERQASVSNPPVRWIFITRFIPVEPKFLSLIGKLSVRDNQLFMN